MQLSLVGPYLGWWAVKKVVATEFSVTKYVVLTGAQVRLAMQPFSAAECLPAGLSRPQLQPISGAKLMVCQEYLKACMASLLSAL